MVALPAVTAIPQTEIDSLVAGAAAGDVACFNALYQRDADRVYNHVLRSCGNPAEAEDVCQEVWTRASRSIGSLREAGAFDTWVMRIATRACIDAARRRHVEYDDAQLATVSDGSDVSEVVEEQEHRQLAWQALGALPQRQRLALYLREVDGLRYTDIAEALGTTPTAVETLLFRARHSLAQAYDRLADSPDERCQRARQIMAVIMDGEGDAAEQRSLKAHLGDCHACQHHMRTLNRGKRAYAALPFAGVAGSMAPTLLPAATGAGIGGGAWLGAGKLTALLSKAVSSFFVPSLTAATLTVAALTVAGPVQDVLQPASNAPHVATMPQTSASVSADVKTAPAALDQTAAEMQLTGLIEPPAPIVSSLPAVDVPAPIAAPTDATAPLQTQAPPQTTVAPPPIAVEAPASTPQQVAALLPPAVPVAPPPVSSLPAVQTVTSLLPQATSALPQLPVVPQLGAVTSSLPTVTLPQVTVPALTTPQVSLPSVTAPQVTVAPVTIPQVTVPQVTVPQVTVPQVTVPQVSVPPVSAPLVPQVPTTTSTQPTTLPVAVPPVVPPAPIVPGLGLPIGR